VDFEEPVVQTPERRSGHDRSEGYGIPREGAATRLSYNFPVPQEE
jgi:hypothetical protein